MLIREGHKVSWKRSRRHGEVMKRCSGVGGIFPDKQDSLLEAMESEFPPHSDCHGGVVIPENSAFITSLFTLSPLQHSRPKMEKNH